MQQKIWHAWWSLAASSRRRHNERLAKIAEQIVASGDHGKASPSKLVDHSEWWERGSKSPTKKIKAKVPKSPLKMAAMV